MKLYSWNEQKNEWLSRERGISFEDVVHALENKKLLDITPHPNRDKYPGQNIIYVEIAGYVYAVPCIENDGMVFLKTVFPSRTATKRYLGE